VPDLKEKPSELLQRYERDKTKPRTEADVSANFIDHLFAALGWDITNPNEYNRQRYVREAGFADIGLLLHGEPRVFVEVKRFGLIPKSAERTGDRTPEEKQAFKYARQEKIKWAILTNFERLHVFDADQERLILAFDDPQDYPRRIEDLNRLTKAHIERDSLEHLAQLQGKENLDRGFLESLKRWRKLLAQDVLDHIPEKELEPLVALRRRVRATDDDIGKRKLLDEAAEKTRKIAAPLDEPLKTFFPDPSSEHPFHWVAEFPEVFSRDNGGFDVVVGNPPYLLLQPQNVDPESLKFYREFPVTQYKLDIYHLFINRAVDLLVDGGSVGYITPAPFLMNNYTVNLRKYVLESCAVQKLVVIPDGVFPDASVDNVVFIFQRVNEQPKRARSLIRYAIVPAYVNPDEAAWAEMLQGKIMARKDLLFVLSASEEIEPKSETQPLKEVATVNFGMQLRDRKKFRTDVVQTDDPSSLSRYHEPCWDGGGAFRYDLRFQNLYAYVNEEARQGGCWDMSVHRAKEKVIVRQIGDRPICAFDDSRRVCLNTVFMVVPKAQYSAKFILAALNSCFMAHFWQQHYSDYKRTFPKIKGTYLLELPMPKIAFEKRLEKSKHDELVKVADKMIRLHRQKAAAEHFFAEALNNHPHEWRELGDTYWNRQEYVEFIGKKTHVKPSDTGAVTGLRCELDDESIQISAEIAGDWKPILDMTVSDEGLRFFIFYSIRQFLRDYARKRKWGDGKLLALALERIKMPVFLSHGVHDIESHLKALKLVLAEMKKHSPLHNLTELERDIAATDVEIDQLVCKLYELTKNEIKLVEEATRKPS